MRKSFSGVLLVGCVALSACSMKTAREQKPADAPKTEVSHEPKQTAQPTTETVTVAAAHETAHEPQSKEPTKTAVPAAAHHEEKNGVAPEKALGWLKNGNTRFIKSSLRKDGQSTADIKRLSTGQTPHTIVLSCSDSRVPPEIIFDQKLGEIFVVRNAGEIPDDASIASIEYAVEHLGARLIVVMGHTSCGAVKAALSTLDGADAGSPALNSLVHDIHPRLASFKGKSPSPGVQAESWANARGISKELLARSAILSAKAASGEIAIKTALYHLDDGKVDFDQ
jgi:carbonic anhydrase